MTKSGNFKLKNPELEAEIYYLTTDINYLNDKFEFELLFATWHSMYLTGKIVAKTIR